MSDTVTIAQISHTKETIMITDFEEMAAQIIRDQNNGRCGDHIRTLERGPVEREVEFTANPGARQIDVVHFNGDEIEYRRETPYTYMKRVKIQ